MLERGQRNSLGWKTPTSWTCLGRFPHWRGRILGTRMNACVSQGDSTHRDITWTITWQAISGGGTTKLFGATKGAQSNIRPKGGR